MARDTMTGLIAEFRLQRADLTSSVITDSEIVRLFDHNRLYLDKVNLWGNQDLTEFESPVKFVESGASILSNGDTAVSPDATFFIEGRFTFTTAQSSSLRIRGYYHNLYYALAEAMRMVASEDDRWSRYKRGEVELDKADVSAIADNYERMGFVPKNVRMERG